MVFDPSQVAIASDLEAMKIGCLYFPAVVPHTGISDDALEFAMGCLDRGLMERVLAWRDERAAGLLPAGPAAAMVTGDLSEEQSSAMLTRFSRLLAQSVPPLSHAPLLATSRGLAEPPDKIVHLRDVLRAYATELDSDADERFDVKGFGVQVSIAADLLDVEETSWEHIRAFRQDPASAEALNRFRRFLHGDVSGKSEIDIRGRFFDAMEAYEKEVDKLGGKRRRTVLTQVANATASLGTGIVALAASMMGVPLTAVVAGGVGAFAGQRVVIDLVKGALAYDETQQDLARHAKHHPMAYLYEAGSKLDGAKIVKQSF